MMAKLDIKIELRKNARDSSTLIDNIRDVFRRWMPLPTVLLDTLVEKCPNPRNAIDETKLALLVPNDKFLEARKILQSASTERSAPVVVFITKFMFQSINNNDLIGLGRIYSGQARADLKMFLFTPRFNPGKVAQSFYSLTANDFDEGPIDVYDDDDNNNGKNRSGDVSVIRLGNVYQFRGQDTILLKDGAPAGHIVGFTGLDCQQAFKNITLVANCSLADCLGMFSQHDSANDELCNIICVSVQPKKVAFLNELQSALYLLEKCDPIVNVSFSLSLVGGTVVAGNGDITMLAISLADNCFSVNKCVCVCV